MHEYKKRELSTYINILFKCCIHHQQEEEQNPGYTVKPVFRDHIQDVEKWPYMTYDLIKQVQFI